MLRAKILWPIRGLEKPNECTGFHRFHVVFFRYRSRVLLSRDHLPYYGSCCSTKRWANNQNLINQINFLIVIKIESENNSKFILKGNIVHISLKKYRKITRIIFISKLYVIIVSINILISIFTIITIIIDKLNLSYLFTIVYVNSFLLYEYIIKLNTIKEKRLIINIIVIW